MHKQRLAQLSLWATAAFAFQDTSPFFLFSTSSLPTVGSIPEQQVAQSSQLTSFLLDELTDCPSDAYVVVSQPGVSAIDFKDSRSAPLLQQRISRQDESKIAQYLVSEAVGQVDVSSLEEQLMNKCGAKHVQVDSESGSISLGDEYPQLISVKFATPASSSPTRQSQLGKHDFFLDAILNSITPRSYTVIYTTTPPTAETLEAQRKENAAPKTDRVHMDLKRDIHEHANVNKRDNDSNSDRGLFERYNFLSPGIFMGLIAGLILLLILYNGISAVSGLQVSYAAFSKEMGPKAQAKQQ